MATADYYREQAESCRQMSRICPDPVLADRLDVLAAEFLAAAADQDEDLRLSCIRRADARAMSS